MIEISELIHNTRMVKQLSEDDMEMLRVLVEGMIPKSEEYGVPGAGEELIFKDILTEVRHNLSLVHKELCTLSEIAEQMFGTSYRMLKGDNRHHVSKKFLELTKEGAIVRIVLQCYYRDDRVMRSLGMEPRPPFPLGHAIEDPDWSLLEGVRKKKKTYRST